MVPVAIAQSSSEEPAMDPNQISSEEFEQADVNKDGGLSFDEAVGLIASLTQAQFDQLDGNDDGLLSPAEVSGVGQNGSLLSGTTGASSSEPAP
jgi:hypothetical protein